MGTQSRGSPGCEGRGGGRRASPNLPASAPGTQPRKLAGGSRARRARRPSFVRGPGRGAALPRALPAPHLTRRRPLRPRTALPRRAQGPAPRNRRAAAPRSSLLPGAARRRAAGAPRRHRAPGSFGRGTRYGDASWAATAEGRGRRRRPARSLSHRGQSALTCMSRRPAGPRAPARRSARPGSSSARLRWVGRARRLAVGGPCPAGGARCRPCLLLSASGLGPRHWTLHPPPGAGLAARTRALRSGSPARASAWSPRCGGSLRGPGGTPLLPGRSWVSGPCTLLPPAALGGGSLLGVRDPRAQRAGGNRGAEPAAEPEGGPGPWAPGSGRGRLSSLGCALSSGARDPKKFRPQVGCRAGGGRGWECSGRRWASGSRGLHRLRPASRASSPPPGSRAGPRLTPSHRQSPRHPSPGLLPGAGTVTSAPASRRPGLLARPPGPSAELPRASTRGCQCTPHSRGPGGAQPAPFPPPSTPAASFSRNSTWSSERTCGTHPVQQSPRGTQLSCQEPRTRGMVELEVLRASRVTSTALPFTPATRMGLSSFECPQRSRVNCYFHFTNPSHPFLARDSHPSTAPSRDLRDEEIWWRRGSPSEMFPNGKCIL